MKWPKYQKVIRLEIQVRITSHINKWANVGSSEIPEMGSGA
jgi:hypothetical protein